ncbi:MAG: hypothetical protein IKQ95_10360 [Synergistaceae bacterium]|nr:hypothetical protein [Synergistaceae bacterium]
MRDSMLKVFALLSILIMPICSYGADISALEREGMIMRVELNRLGNDSDPEEREEILRKIAERCKGTEEGESAYWDLADLYLEGFPDERRKDARDILELCLKNYPNSRRASIVKCRLIELYDAGTPRRAELVRQLKNDSSLPNILKSTLN